MSGSNCAPISRKPYRVCAGNLKRVVTLYTRNILAPAVGSVDYSESINTPRVVYAMIETANGETIFDNTNTERVVTHHFYIRFLPNVSFEAWLLFRGRYYDIIGVENLNEENRFILLKTNVRGPSNMDVNWS